MPLYQLAVTPEDVSGAALGLVLNGTPPPTLAACRLSHPAGGALRLGVLGASHVVAIEHRLELLDQIADGLDIGIFKAIGRTH